MAYYVPPSEKVGDMSPTKLRPWPHICMVLFFAHIPFVGNHTFNATPPERLQQYFRCVMLYLNKRKMHPFNKTYKLFCVKAKTLSKQSRLFTDHDERVSRFTCNN